MPDLKITEFRERAESGVPIPDLAAIEDRGRALRRRRVAAAMGGLALVVAAGAGLAGIATDGGDAAPDPATPPSPAPTTSWDDGVRTQGDVGEELLVPGPSEVLYGDLAVRFDAPGNRWEWWSIGMGLRRHATDGDDYAASVFFLSDASVRLQPCGQARAQELGTDPDDLVGNVTPLLDMAHSTVLQAPQVVDAFGGEAVHLRLETEGHCPDGQLPAQLRGVVNDADYDPGWEDRYVLDLWHVVHPGSQPASLLVASWDMDGGREHRIERQALLDSVEIEAR